MAYNKINSESIDFGAQDLRVGSISLNGTGVTSTPAELNILTGVTATAAEINAAADSSANVEVVTTTNPLTAAESGFTFFLNSATGFVTTLPAPAAGLRYKFIVGATAPSSGNHTIVTTTSANVIIGALSGSEVDDTVDFDSIADGDTISFVASSAVSGDWAEVISDGTNWYVTGHSVVRAGVTLTQASA